MTPIICRKKLNYVFNTLARNNLTLRSEVLGIGFYPGTLQLQQRGASYKPKKSKSYYDALEITPKATQAQVKKAYYNLSKTYHPDQYRGNEDAAVKFREITEAYEILGNLKKRRMYDKGLLNMDIAASPAEAEEYSQKFYESRSKKHKAPTSTGRTPIYDFDEWSKLHYESSFERREKAKMRYERLQRMQTEKVEERKSETVIYILVVCLVLYCIKMTFTPRNDVDQIKEK